MSLLPSPNENFEFQFRNIVRKTQRQILLTELAEISRDISSLADFSVNLFKPLFHFCSSIIQRFAHPYSYMGDGTSALLCLKPLLIKQLCRVQKFQNITVSFIT